MSRVRTPSAALELSAFFYLASMGSNSVPASGGIESECKLPKLDVVPLCGISCNIYANMLKIRIYSFGYKKSGIPKDETSNGGGFVFDCRFIYNPGRIQEFANLTGKDKEVVDFLDNHSDMQEFLRRSSVIVKTAAENFQSRNFSDLMVCYGCTGGQHRSIYAAQKLKEFLVKTFDGNLSIEVHHTEFPQLSS